MNGRRTCWADDGSRRQRRFSAPRTTTYNEHLHRASERCKKSSSNNNLEKKMHEIIENDVCLYIEREACALVGRTNKCKYFSTVPRRHAVNELLLTGGALTCIRSIPMLLCSFLSVAPATNGQEQCECYASWTNPSHHCIHASIIQPGHPVRSVLNTVVVVLLSVVVAVARAGLSE